MNFRGGCCIARYGGGGAAAATYDMSKVDRIMLRYRPIAPKPDISGSSTPPDNTGSASVSPKTRRGKRKNSKENTSSSGSVTSNGNSKRCQRRRIEEPKNGSGFHGAVAEMVTLPLLPETPERKDSPSPFPSSSPSPSPSSSSAMVFADEKLGAASLWLNFGNGARSFQTVTTLSDLTSEAIVRSWVTVECVTDTCGEGEYELGCTDEEKRMNLERDTCPGFISDGEGRVIWSNRSYRELVIGKDEQRSKMSVWVVMKERPMLTYRTFTCRTRLQYTCREKEMGSVTSPCDVWRMNDGGFAWRLDVNAALSLGR